MENNSKNSVQPLLISVNYNPFASKAAMAVLGNLDNGDLVRMCEQEFINGCKFNAVDMAFYVMALESLHDALMTSLDQRDLKMLENLRKHAKVITTHVNTLKPNHPDHDDPEGGEPDEQ